jgi:hypothetical protein
MNSLRLSLNDDLVNKSEEQDLIVVYSRIDRFLQNNLFIEKHIAGMVATDKQGHKMSYQDRTMRWLPMIFVLIMHYMVQSESPFDKTTVNQIMKLINKDVNQTYVVDVSTIGLQSFNDQMLWHQFVLHSRIFYALGLLMQQCDLVDSKFLAGTRSKSIVCSEENQPEPAE